MYQWQSLNLFKLLAMGGGKDIFEMSVLTPAAAQADDACEALEEARSVLLVTRQI
jgi:hypothetical protein